MITDTEALRAIDVIASYCDKHMPKCSTCVLREYCEIMQDREVPIPWLIDDEKEDKCEHSMFYES